MSVHDLWTTPHGVIKAAMTNNASPSMRTVDGKTFTAVSFAVPGRYRATARINAAGMVVQIESTQPHPVAGDTASVVRFSDYKDTGGVKFPMRIQKSMGGHPVLDLTVNDVKPNAPAGIEVSALVAAFAENIAATEVADGVWHMAVESHNSVAIEMKDHIMMVESSLYDGRVVPVSEPYTAIGKKMWCCFFELFFWPCFLVISRQLQRGHHPLPNNTKGKQC